MKEILILILFFMAGVCFAAEEKTTLKVGISDSEFSSYEHVSARFILQGASSVVDMACDTKKDVRAGSFLSVNISNGLFSINIEGFEEIQNAKGPIVITSSEKIGISGLKRKNDPAYYTGMIELKSVKPDKFNIINVLDMQSYLKGVVPNEMPVSFGLEALKAQAVAARNYANREAKVYANYDVCDSTACQVYYGVNGQTAISDRAVDETLGIYALYNNEIILSLYSSTASGITEDYFNTFGNFEEEKPYLKSVKDTLHLTKMDDAEYFKKAPPSFDMNSPKYRWEIEFDRFELENILSKTLFEQSKRGSVSPSYAAGDKLYGLESIKVLKRGDSRKALEVEIRAISGTYTVKKELPIRRVFNGLLSANFIIEKEKPAKQKVESFENDKEAVFQDENRMYKTPFDKKLPKKFKFYGAGFGHGVGMSQYGAGFLSGYGIPYDKILSHYYTGINLGTMPKTVSYNDLEVDYIQEFYFTKEKNKAASFSKSPLKNELNALMGKSNRKRCFLTVENPNTASNVEFFINGYYFNQNMEVFKKKVLKTEITTYLQEGKNKIVFKPLAENDRKKTVRFYITLEDENG